jgi:hypothetical protein
MDTLLRDSSEYVQPVLVVGHSNGTCHVIGQTIPKTKLSSGFQILA